MAIWHACHLPLSGRRRSLLSVREPEGRTAASPSYTLILSPYGDSMRSRLLKSFCGTAVSDWRPSPGELGSTDPGEGRRTVFRTAGRELLLSALLLLLALLVTEPVAAHWTQLTRDPGWPAGARTVDCLCGHPHKRRSANGGGWYGRAGEDEEPGWPREAPSEGLPFTVYEQCSSAEERPSRVSVRAYCPSPGLVSEAGEDGLSDAVWGPQAREGD